MGRWALRRLLDDPAPRVIALGGGALLDPSLRRAALERACVVTLTASPRTLAARSLAAPRPLLDAEDGSLDREAHVRALLASRAGAYAEAHAQVATDDTAPDDVATRILRAYADRPILVPLGPRTYGVRLAADPFASTADALAALDPTQVFLVTDDNVHRLWGDPMRAALAAAGLSPATIVPLVPGEQHKRLAAVETALTTMIDAGADRRAVVLAHGGGVVSDIAGFAAAILFRGVRWVIAPTTLLAMVDASVGGKTGVDLGAAKNAIGAFHQPSAVIAGPAHLATEDARAFRSGLAEAVKTACIGDPAILDALERDPDPVLARDPAVLTPILRRGVAVKAAIVARDERETGFASAPSLVPSTPEIPADRALLNFGHTLGHALEAQGDFRDLLHGEAVALGMVAMLRVGRALGVTAASAERRVIHLLDRLGLPTALADQSIPDALRLLSLDKKRRGSTLRVVLLRDIGAAFIEEIPLDRLAALLLAAARPISS